MCQNPHALWSIEQHPTRFERQWADAEAIAAQRPADVARSASWAQA